MGPLPWLERPPQKDSKEIMKEIQAIIRQITASVTFLPLLDEPCAPPTLPPGPPSMDSQHYNLKSPWTYTRFPSPLSCASHSRRRRLLRSPGVYQRRLVSPDQLGRERPEVHQQLRDREVTLFYDHRPQSWCDGELPHGGLAEAWIRLGRVPLRSPSPALESAEPPEPTHPHQHSFRPTVSIPYLFPSPLHCLLFPAASSVREVGWGWQGHGAGPSGHLPATAAPSHSRLRTPRTLFAPPGPAFRRPLPPQTAEPNLRSERRTCGYTSHVSASCVPRGAGWARVRGAGRGVLRTW